MSNTDKLVKNIWEAGALAERKRILDIVEKERKDWLKNTMMSGICERIRDNIKKLYI